MRSPFRRASTHLVDDVGRIGCPRQRRDVPLEHCLRCRELIEVRRDPAGEVTEIRCRTTGRRPSPQDAWDPLGPLASFRP